MPRIETTPESAREETTEAKASESVATETQAEAAAHPRANVPSTPARPLSQADLRKLQAKSTAALRDRAAGPAEVVDAVKELTQAVRELIDTVKK